MTSTSSLRETLLSTTDAWMQAHLSYDFTTISTLRTPNTKYHQRPASLHRPVHNNEQWDEIFPQFHKMIQNHDMKFNETLVDEIQRKVILFTVETGNSKNGVPFENEGVFVISLSEQGDKVVEHWGFVDSAFMIGFMKEVMSGGGMGGGKGASNLGMSS